MEVPDIKKNPYSKLKASSSTKKWITRLFICFGTFMSVQASSFDFSKDISSIYNPSREDYQRLEKYLSEITDEDLPPMRTTRCRTVLNSMKLVGKDFSENPTFEIIYVNQNPESKARCVILYTTYNDPYPQNVHKIITLLQKTGFDGHILFRIGGYPNLEEGCLELVDVPYAFKACAFKEAYRLGYKNILWIDASMSPIKSIDPLFTTMEEHGYFVMTSGSFLQKEVDAELITFQTLNDLEITYEESFFAPHITTPVFGINTESSVGFEILNQFYTFARARKGFFCNWPDEAPLSVILYKMNLPSMGVWQNFFVKDWEWDKVESHHYFSMSARRPAEREQNFTLSEETKNSIRQGILSGIPMPLLCRFLHLDKYSLFSFFDKECSKIYFMQNKEIVINGTELVLKRVQANKLWPQYLCKAKDIWIWLAFDMLTGYVVAAHFGKETNTSLKALWDQIPRPYFLRGKEPVTEEMYINFNR